MKYADLHIHTHYSDSTHSPEDVVRLAKQFDLQAIAITDHDTVDAIEPALKCASGLEVIPGIELTAETNNIEVHILGYFIDWQDREFCKKLEEIKQIRRERIYKFRDKLKTLGIDIEPEEIIQSAGRGTVGRLHIAKYLLKKGYISFLKEAFDKFIGDNRAGYVSAFRLKPAQATEIIKNTGGIPVLAHPHSLSNQGLIFQLIEDGIMGLEVFYPEHTKIITHHYEIMAARFGLLVTGGSDCHGKMKNNILLGKFKIPYELVEKLKQSLKK